MPFRALALEQMVSLGDRSQGLDRGIGRLFLILSSVFVSIACIAKSEGGRLMIDLSLRCMFDVLQVYEKLFN